MSCSQEQAIVESGVLVRGDLAKVKIGKYCLILENSVVRPSFKVLSGGLSFFPTQIGSYTHIGRNCVIEALKIGSFVRIGDNCIIVGSCVYFMPNARALVLKCLISGQGKRCILSDCCVIEDGSILPPDTVTAPFTTYRGIPGVCVM